MKLKLPLLFVSVLLLNASTVSASKITGNLDVYQMGHWAMKQHNSICQLVYPALTSNKTKALNFSKEGALEMLSTEYTVFVSTDADDPTIGFDSVIVYPMYAEFVQFVQGPTSFWVKPKLDVQAIELDARFMTLLNAEQKLYLKLYQNKGDIRYENIPSKSLELLTNLNIKLYNEGRKPATLLYKNDSLKSTYDQYTKNSRGREEVVVFINTDPSDPTIGYDSTYLIPYSDIAKDTNKFQALSFVMSQAGASMKLEALSAGFEGINYYTDISIRLHFSYGFIKYPLITSLTPTEKSLVEYCIASAIDSKLKLYDSSYGFYLQSFKIIPKGTLKKNPAPMEWRIESQD